MALFSFSQKNKTPADAQTPAPPKLQPPPPPGPSASNPTVPPSFAPPPVPSAAPGAPPLPRPGPTPPPTAPSLGKAVSATTRGVTQPIVMPKRGPGAPVRSTQRIVVPGAPTPPESAPQFHTSSIQLPVSMILRAVQMAALAGPLAELEKTPQGGQKISVPLSMILPQLPSGKIEIPMQDLVPLIPAELLASRDRLAPYLSSSVHLPLMEVVMLIPPDMLALRPDQKQVDTSVTSMADPFTEESIRKAAEETRREKAAAESGISTPEFGAAERTTPPLAAGMTSTAPMPRTSRPTPPSTTSTPPPVATQPPPPPPRTPTSNPAGSAPPTMPPVTRLPTPSTMSRPGTISLPMVNRPGTKALTPTAAPEPVVPPPPAAPSFTSTPQPTRATTLPPPPPTTSAPLSRPTVQRTPPPPPAPEPVPQYSEETDQQTEYPGQEEPAYESAPQEVEAEVEQPVEPPPAAPQAPEPAKPQRPAGPLNLNTCAADDLALIPGISSQVAQSIVTYRQKIGAFRKLQDLLDVPGMTRGIYGLLTGEESQPTTVNDLLGFPTDQNLTLKDITERISCWPDVTGCVLGQSNGLPIMGHLSPKVKMDKAAIVAFAPRMFEALNKSFVEMAGIQTDELIIPTSDTSFHILRKGDLYLIILARTPQMPSRHLQVARLVLASLNFK